ncbi:PH domain-containing protein [Nocardioides ganghwensis]|uniref:PH domain-containing protein n=1 Tax=Nocardioides ganghwensis TaxID=252230 RepID=A0A4Q2SDW9_9ACTN|nr:PH domain-containing protein [Nocardioides ganghwensis]MBD3945725.1 PH domain-containing protein [Nocardioides ganghwensis]RYC01128.1 PH domain-containing protein [Nocardioides ganghwensis]
MAFPSNLLNPGEHVVVSTRTHVKALIFPGLGVLVALAAALFLTGLVEGGVVRLIVWVLFLAVLVWFLVGPFLRWATTTYTFTNRRFIKRSGFISKEGRTIPLNRISGVDFEIGVIDRVFGCGTLVVSDASTDGSVELYDIPDVEKVQLQVSDELHRLASGDRRDDGA